MNVAKSEPSIKKCLVLGGSGFIGSHLVERLVASGYKVRVLARHIQKNKLDVDNKKESNIEFFSADFTNESDLEMALNDVDYVFHLVSTTTPKHSNENPIHDIEMNLIGTIKLLDLIKLKKDIKLVFISSGGTVYGIPEETPIAEKHSTKPICSYGITKLAIEKYLYLYNYLYGLDYVVLRVSNPYGEKQNPDSSQGVIAVFMLRLLKDQPIQIWGDGSVARDFIYIDDVISAIIAAMNSSSVERVFNIGSGIPVDINEIIKSIEVVSDKLSNIEYMEGRKLDVPVNCLDISLAVKHLGWTPQTQLLDGLKKTWCWLKGNYIK